MTTDYNCGHGYSPDDELRPLHRLIWIVGFGSFLSGIGLSCGLVAAFVWGLHA